MQLLQLQAEVADLKKKSADLELANYTAIADKQKLLAKIEGQKSIQNKLDQICTDYDKLQKICNTLRKVNTTKNEVIHALKKKLVHINEIST